MQLKSESFVLEIAYSLTPPSRVPVKASICKLFWRFLFFLLVFWPIIGMGFLLLCIVVGISYFLGFWLTWQPSMQGGNWKPYNRWPAIFGYRLYPIYLFVPLAIYWLAQVALPVIQRMIVKIDVTPDGLSIAGLYLMAVGCLILAAAVKFFRSEPGILLITWLRAKAEKICPYVDIVD